MNVNTRTRLLQLVGGVLFGIGLAVSGMLKPEVVLSFLHLEDFGLLVTMGSALLIATPIYQAAPRLREQPACGTSFEQIPRKLGRHHVIGSVLFGVGWGLSGVCPGAAVASLGAGNVKILFALGGMLLGAYVERRLLRPAS